MQITDSNGNVYGWDGLEINGPDGKAKVPVINTDITIGTTAIVGGAVNRILFQGIGNVVQESSSFTYDDTLKKFTLTGPIGSVIQHTALTNYNGLSGFQLNVADGTERAFFKLNPSTGEIRIGGTGSGYFPTFYAQGVEAMRIFASTRNVGINTTTDAGYKTDINGSLRVNSSFSITSPSFAGGFSFTMNAANTLVANSSNIGTWLQVGGGNRVYIVGQEFNSTSRGNNFGNTVGGEAVGIANIIAQSSGTTALTGLGIRYAINNTGTYSGIVRGLYYNPTLTSLIGTTHRAIETVTGDVLFATTSGSLLVGTSTLAGFKADINGTVRIVNALTLGGVVLSLSSQGGGTISSANSAGNNTGPWINLNGPAYFNPATGNNGLLNLGGQYFVQSGNSNFNHLGLSPIINASGTYAGTIRGFYYNPTLTSITGVTHYAFHSTSGRIRFENLPTSSAGLSSGEIWNNSGVLQIV